MNNFYETKRVNGLLHNDDGPAVVQLDGTQIWYQHGVKHRLDGPAVVWADGTKEWWVAGYCHRRAGFAIEYPDGTGAKNFSPLAAAYEKVSAITSLQQWLAANRSSFIHA